MDISDAPNAAETKSRREKDGVLSSYQFVVFHCLLLELSNQKQNGRHTRTTRGSADGRPCPVNLFGSRPAAIDRALRESYCNGRASSPKNN
ncbi:MAG: hypothetical protein IPJ38_06075 [Dechloromonas sp.]|uniref:Uncharacterized protein n=1 Tax=Candidatus Dechloromonas phosphorivorans TaxID=2899244 RepID=A0A935N1W9_9RHOO|nr:hypothetical protein [Candidatus Dechloromonas phosphorivorans]